MFLRISLRCAILVALLGLVWTGATTAAISTFFVGTTLTITSDADDDFGVGCTGPGGDVTVNGTPISGPVACASVVTLMVNGGPGDNNIYLWNITSADFSSLVGPIQVDAGAGNDRVDGSEFDDAILGGDGNDFLQGGPGGTDTLDGQGGGDASVLQIDPAVTQTVTANDTGADPADQDQTSLNGSNASDSVNVTDSSFTAGAQSMSFSGMEQIQARGNDGDDTLDGSASTVGVWIEGGPGNDVVTGGSGDDQLNSFESGNDTINGGDGHDNLTSTSFGPGTDTLDGQGDGDDYNVNLETTTAVTIADSGAAPLPPPCPGCWTPDDDKLHANGTSAADTIVVTDAQMTLGAGTISYTGLEHLNVQGRSGNDTLDASAVTATRVTLVGEGGNDTLTGGASSDQLNGDEWPFGPFCGGPCPIPPPPGDDVLNGGAGNDQLHTFGGTDTLDGQGGDDNYNVPLAVTAPAFVTNPANGHLYGLTEWGAWADAEQSAVDWGGHLVTLNDAAEETWVVGAFGSDQQFWIGFNDIAVEGTFEWSSGEGITYTNWCPFEPNNSFGTEDAAVLNANLSGGPPECWNDLDPAKGPRGIMELNGAPPAPVLNPTISDSGASGWDSLNAQGTPAADAIFVTNTQVTLGATVVTFSGIEQPGANGADGDDTIDASAAMSNVNLNGQAGNDTLIGGAGNDQLGGDDWFFGCSFCPPPPPPGNDTMTGNGGNDNMNGNGGNDSYDGGDGSDNSNVQLFLAGSSTVTDSGPPGPPCPPCGPGDNDSMWANGTPGDDFIYSNGSSYWMTGLGSVSHDATIERPTAAGQDGNDTLDGTGALLPVSFHGNAGNDTLIGGDGDDWLKADDFYGPGCGGCPPEPPPGDDTTTGGGGNDYLFVGGGTDSLDGQDGSDRVEVRIGWTGSATIADTGASTDDDEVGFFGNAGNDTITIGAGTGSLGAQTASFTGIELVTANGENGDDTINAAAATSNVSLNGGSGSDVLTGGSGADSLNGDGCCGFGPYVPGNDILNGGAGGDNLWGDDGDDTLDGGTGNDWMGGGLGTDTVTYASRTVGVKVSIGSFGWANDGQPGEGDNVDGSVENVIGGLGADSLTGSGGPNVLNGGPGNDTLDGGFGPDVFVGGAGTDSAVYTTRTNGVTVTMGGGGPDGEFGGAEGDDVQGDVEKLSGGSGNDVLTGTPNVDTISGNGGNDVISGLGNNDLLLGNAGADTLNGGDGTDLLDGGAGADVLNGGAGIDTVTYALRSNPLNVSVDGVANDGEAGEGDNVGGDNEKILGGSAGDVISGGPAAETLMGNNGADTLNGGGGNDLLYGGNGNDSLNGGDGLDTLDGGAGGDAMNGGLGVDTVTYQLRSAALNVSIGDGLANDGEAGEGDNVGADSEKVLGGSAADVLTGDGGANTLFGYGGNDTINGGGGNDVLDGGLGADVLDGGVGTADSVYYTTRTASVFLTLDDLLANDGEAGEGDQVLNMERAYTGSGADTITGNAAINYIYAGAGNDSLNGLGGIDYLYGQAGADTLTAAGDGAADRLNCGTEVDGGTADSGLDIINADCEAVVLI